MSRCAVYLRRVPEVPDNYVMVCDCCGRAWQHRRRTRWLTAAFWKTTPGRDGDWVWVRLPRSESLLAVNDGERG